MVTGRKMFETLWERLCTVEVPEQYAAIAARARERLIVTWMALQPLERAAVLEVLGEDPGGEAQDLLLRLSTLSRDLYNAAIGVRGLVVLAVEVGGVDARPQGRLIAHGRGLAGRRDAAGRQQEKGWAGLPLEYQECEHPWYAAVSLELSRGQLA